METQIKKFSFTVEVVGGSAQIIPGEGDQSFDDHIDGTIHLLCSVINHMVENNPEIIQPFTQEMLRMVELSTSTQSIKSPLYKS